MTEDVDVAKADLYVHLMDLLLVFGPTIGYIGQYRNIVNSRSSAGFDPKTCLILLVANILRIFFWFGKRFEEALLYQSVVMVVVILVLLEACIRFKPPRMPQTRKIQDFRLTDFWNWDDFNSYFIALSVFIMGTFCVCWYYMTNPMFVELLGTLALGVEACLAVPQAISNWRTKSVKGLSFFLIGNWFAGDFGKTLLFILKGSPSQFVMCGVAQLTMDLVVLLQIAMYS